MKPRVGVVLLFIFLLSMVLPFGAQADQADTVIYIIPASGDIGDGLARFIERGLAEAEEAGASGVILEINTLGGSVTSAQKIKDSIFASPLPVVAFVKGRAFSAGALITIACDTIIMSPASSMGASETIPYTEKNIAAWDSEMRGTAAARGRDEEIASAMVKKEISIEGLVKEGDLLGLTAEQAKELGYADAVLGARSDILEFMGWAGARVVEVKPAPAERLAMLITSPIFSVLLLGLAFAALFLEIITPGFGVAGAIGLTSFVLFLGGSYLAGFAGVEVLVLFFVGLVLLMIEIVVPGFGFFGIGGIIAVLLSVVLSFETVTLGLQALFFALVIAALLGFLSLKFVKKTRAWDQLILGQRATRGEGYVAPPDASHFIGMGGKAVTPLRPAGTAEIDGRRLTVVTEGEWVASGTELEVVGVEGARIIVRPRRVE